MRSRNYLILKTSASDIERLKDFIEITQNTIEDLIEINFHKRNNANY